MKLKYDLEMMEMDHEVMAIPIGSDLDFKGILRVNSTAADILRLLKNESSEDELVATMLKEYDASEEEMRESVREIVDQLRKNDLLSE